MSIDDHIEVMFTRRKISEAPEKWSVKSCVMQTLKKTAFNNRTNQLACWDYGIGIAASINARRPGRCTLGSPKSGCRS